MTNNFDTNTMLNSSENYYNLLEIDKNSDEETIKKAYKQQALRFHPDRNIDNKEESEIKFKQISEAYCVLSDINKRKTYDQFGLSGLKGNGININISPFEIFNSFFGTDPSFSNGMPNVMFMSSTISMDSMNNFKSRRALKAEPIIRDIDCSLYDVYNGSHLSIKITKLINVDGVLTKCSEVLDIEVPKGTEDKDKITLKNIGNESIEGDKGDIIIIFNVIEDSIYKRYEND
jgi:DnaJ-class molecular chaperone